MYLCDECCEVFEEKTEFETCPNCFSHKVFKINDEVDEEQMFEMRAAFGEGETVVNVLTGRTYKL